MIIKVNCVVFKDWTYFVRFKLAKWATGDIDTETVSRSEDFVEHCNSLADQWLGLMIAMTSERYVSGMYIHDVNDDHDDN